MNVTLVTFVDLVSLGSLNLAHNSCFAFATSLSEKYLYVFGSKKHASFNQFK